MAKPPIKAQQLAGVLEERIRSGEWKPGDWLPSERQLAESYESGRSTVRQAVEMLVSAGLAESVAGSGTRVVAVPAREPGRWLLVDRESLQEQLEAIRGELREVNDRLSTIEGRSGADPAAC